MIVTVSVSGSLACRRVQSFKPAIDATDWVISKITHTLNDGGQTCQLELERKLGEMKQKQAILFQICTHMTHDIPPMVFTAFRRSKHINIIIPIHKIDDRIAILARLAGCRPNIAWN